jgi:hypothetical protein
LRRRSDEQDRLNRSRVVWNAAEDDSADALKSALGITGLLTTSLGECWPRLGWRGPKPWATRINEQLVNDPRWAELSTHDQRQLLHAGVYALGVRYLERDIKTKKREASVLKIEHAIPLRALTHDFLASDMRVYLRDTLLRGEGRSRSADPESDHDADAIEDEVPLAAPTQAESDDYGVEAGWADAVRVNPGVAAADWLHQDRTAMADAESRTRDMAFIEQIMDGDKLLQAVRSQLSPRGPCLTLTEAASKLDIDPKTITRHVAKARRAFESLRQLSP